MCEHVTDSTFARRASTTLRHSPTSSRTRPPAARRRATGPAQPRVWAGWMTPPSPPRSRLRSFAFAEWIFASSRRRTRPGSASSKYMSASCAVRPTTTSAHPDYPNEAATFAAENECYGRGAFGFRMLSRWSSTPSIMARRSRAWAWMCAFSRRNSKRLKPTCRECGPPFTCEAAGTASAHRPASNFH